MVEVVPREVVVRGLSEQSERAETVIVSVRVRLVIRVVASGVLFLDLVARALTLRVHAEAELVCAGGDTHVLTIREVVELRCVTDMVVDDLGSHDGRDV